jgi:hypothetical protein
MTTVNIRREVDAHLFALQYQLIFDRHDANSVAPAPPLDASALALRRRRLVRVAASFLEPAHYDAVVEERSVNRLCGYPVCARTLPSLHVQPKFRIAPRQGKVYSASSSARFCCEQCAVASAFYAKQLSAVNIHLRDLTRPLLLRFIDDDTSVDAWVRDGPLLNSLFARLRLERSGRTQPVVAPPAASSATTTTTPTPSGVDSTAVLADVVREVAPERRNVAPAPVIAGRPLAIDGYTPKSARPRKSVDVDDDDDDLFDDDDVDAEALKRFLDTGQHADSVEQVAAPIVTTDVTDADVIAAFGKPVAPKVLATENYSDFVRVWLLFDLWRPDLALESAATLASREVAPLIDEDAVGDDPDDDLMLTDVDRSQGALRQKALQTMLRDALRELERLCAAPLSDAVRREAQLALSEAALTSQLRDAVPALTPRAMAWLALLLLEASGSAWAGARAALVNDSEDDAATAELAPSPAAKRVDRCRHDALLARAVELVSGAQRDKQQSNHE